MGCGQRPPGSMPCFVASVEASCIDLKWPEAFLSLIIQGGVDSPPSIAPQALHLYHMERQPARATMKSGNGGEAGRPQRLSGFALGLQRRWHDLRRLFIQARLVLHAPEFPVGAGRMLAYTGLQ